MGAPADHEVAVRRVQPYEARKAYVCPGCSGSVPPGVAHVVVWRADSIFGDRAIEDRRLVCGGHASRLPWRAHATAERSGVRP